MPSLVNGLYEFGEFRLDAQRRTLQRGQELVALTPKAFDLLLQLIQSAGKTVTKDDLMKTVWPDSFVEESNLTQTIFMVRKALEETSERRYILTVQGQGYRFLVPVKEAAMQGPEIETPAPPPDAGDVADIQLQSQPQRGKNWRSIVIAFAVIALTLIVASSIWLWLRRHGAAEPSGKIMLAVLPFENFTGDAGQDYFSDGLTEEMISQLGNLDPTHLGVIAGTSVMHYKHSQEPIPRIGQDLGVQYVIEGSVRRDSQRVRITAQLIQVKDLSHLLELQGEIAREVANEVEFSLSGQRPIVPTRKSNAAGSSVTTTPGTKSYEAYDLYLKGRYFWNKRSGDGFRQAADYFQQ